ncbi:type II toxin-antitoxin system RelE family toxin [Campylobacter concisus]|uniref:type II toxin-antitoxin system RelE family toxin n=1 Tax=Campylobacter concisus TaxID=199 RepID=UPI000CD98B1A|nr:type II toxin-antitoxin system RelE/ParE family toxin [Campylobacter concisus]
MKVNFSENALTELTRLGKGISARILKKLKEIERLDNPRDSGKALVGNLAGLWRYRVGDYRIICKINDNELIILVINIKKRSEAYN